jgi:hypothetical protein
MPIPSAITAISGCHPDIAVNTYEILLFRSSSIRIGIFYLSGEPILLHLLRCGAFAVEGPQLHTPTPRICSKLDS